MKKVSWIEWAAHINNQIANARKGFEFLLNIIIEQGNEIERLKNGKKK